MPTTIDNLLSRMTLEEKIGQMILASIEVSRMDAGTREFLRKNHIGNVILFGKNCAGRAALAQLNAEIQHTVMAENGLPALIAIDQEGGCVTRLRSEATVFPSAMVIARTGDPANAYKVGRMMGGELRALGINLDCAPVLDTLSGPAERRYYGQTVQSIADYGCAMARGLRDAGVLACGKHFPGHEQTGADTHFGFVVDNTPRDTLMNSCLTPFCRAMSEDLASVMVSHVCFPALDDTDTPCSMSAPVIQGVLRGQLGYQGLVISDGLQMHAILDQYGAPQGCVQAALAGCDLLIIGNGGDNADPTGKDVQTPCIRALCDAVADGTLPMARVDESVRRILACKLALGWTMPARDAASQDWSNHAALADALAETGVTVQDPHGLLPLPAGTLFIARASGTGTGVTEGDRITESFAPLAARRLGGQCAVYHTVEELPELADVCAAAPAVVFAFGTREEAAAAAQAAEALAAHNPRFCAVCLAALSLCCHYRERLGPHRARHACRLPRAGKPTNLKEGQTMAFFRCDVMSESLGMVTSVLVTMPDTGDLAAAPVVYLLHGLTDNCTGWLRYTQAEHLARTHGAILIVPEVQRSFYTDMACGPKYFTYINQELPTLCRRFFGIQPVPERTYIMGLSMGGYGAMKCAFTAPQQYAGCAGFSSVAEIQAELPQLCRWHEDRAIFPHGIVPPQDDLFDLVEKFRDGTCPMPRLFLACGQQDSLYPANLRLRDTLQAMNWPLTWYEAPGDHNWFFWNDALGRAMKELLEN